MAGGGVEEATSEGLRRCRFRPSSSVRVVKTDAKRRGEGTRNEERTNLATGCLTTAKIIDKLNLIPLFPWKSKVARRDWGLGNPRKGKGKEGKRKKKRVIKLTVFHSRFHSL